MEQKTPFRADLIVALLAVVIGLCTMIVYIYQANIMSKQLHATVWPYLEVNFSTSSNLFAINVQNKGVGPANIKNAYILIDGVRVRETQQSIDSIASLLSGHPGALNSYTNIRKRVLSPGDVITFIEVNDSTVIKALLPALRKHKVTLEICYCSVFDDCWTLNAGNSVEPCESCN